jgi:hypothetical protein
MTHDRPVRSSIPPPAAASSLVEQRAALGQGGCARSACGRPFQRRRSGGIPQRFCSTRCRRLADAEFRRVARSGTSASLPAAPPAPARRSTGQRSSDYWRAGIDAATGRRVRVAVLSPASAWRPGPLPWPGPRPMPTPNPSAQALRGRPPWHPAAESIGDAANGVASVTPTANRLGLATNSHQPHTGVKENNQ